MDLQNPLTVYQDLECDGFLSLFAKESDHMPRLLSFHPSDFRFSIRRTALSLIAQAKFSYGLDPFLVYLSVNYVDRYLSKLQEVVDKRPWIPHILVVASLSLAAKMTNSNNASLLLNVLKSDGGFELDAQSVNRMEKIMLAGLQWRMRSITPFSFLQYFISLLKIQDSCITQSLNTRASDIISNVQQELKLLEYKPSIIAASALLCGIQDLNPPALPSSEAAISSCEYVNKDALLECIGIMAAASSPRAMTSGTSVERQRTSSLSEEGFRETNNVKRRRLNGLRDNNTTCIPDLSERHTSAVLSIKNL
ncbi:hypothetical protein C2S53_011924 [Perilla frutescens var. hirtella]|uniref:B-like cyclin n=1 Tax=Perilla frutescens var. hirtella TaxID=608512 RepID=A0AAD4J884_PERFH|nr:hypothetical protein C2S53_011924 [Perilla frutescens var. hirtella]